MAFTFNSDQTVNGFIGGDNPAIIAVTPGANTVLLVLTTISPAGSGSSGTPTYGGDDMAQAGSKQNSQESATEIWYFLNPTPSVQKNISIPNANSDDIRYAAAFFDNTSAVASLFGANGASDQTGEDVPATIASVPDGSVCVSCMGHGEKDTFASISVGLS